MKTKDLVYIGIIGYLAYLLLKKKQTPTAETTSTTGVPAGNASNGGLNLGTNMDLPNLTPTSPNGLPTEDALGVSNVSPLVKDDNEPTQIFGGVTLPPPYMSTSIVNPYPVDVVPVSTTSSPTASTTSSPTASTPMSGVIATAPVAPVVTSPTPIATGSSLVAEPDFVIKTVKAQLLTNQPILAEPITSKEVIDEIINDCGKSFSIANNDQEGSYTNFWFDGDTFYTQTTSPLIRTIPTKISKEAFVEGCKKFQLIKMQNGNIKG
jgi:hypothetical protein